MIKINGIILAAGASSRFHSNKLLHSFCGGPLIMPTIMKMQKLPLQQCLMVAPDNALGHLAKDLGLTWVVNNQPKLGISHSIQLALEASAPCDGYLFVVGDQPRLSLDTLEAMLHCFSNKKADLICAGYGTQIGNPCLFAASYYDQLLALTGDRGGKSIIQEYSQDTFIYQVTDPLELYDVDTLAQTQYLRDLT